MIKKPQKVKMGKKFKVMAVKAIRELIIKTNWQKMNKNSQILFITFPLNSTVLEEEKFKGKFFTHNTFAPIMAKEQLKFS